MQVENAHHEYMIGEEKRYDVPHQDYMIGEGGDAYDVYHHEYMIGEEEKSRTPDTTTRNEYMIGEKEKSHDVREGYMGSEEEVRRDTANDERNGWWMMLPIESRAMVVENLMPPERDIGEVMRDLASLRQTCREDLELVNEPYIVKRLLEKDGGRGVGKEGKGKGVLSKIRSRNKESPADSWRVLHDMYKDIMINVLRFRIVGGMIKDLEKKVTRSRSMDTIDQLYRKTSLSLYGYHTSSAPTFQLYIVNTTERPFKKSWDRYMYHDMGTMISDIVPIPNSLDHTLKDVGIDNGTYLLLTPKEANVDRMELENWMYIRDMLKRHTPRIGEDSKREYLALMKEMMARKKSY